MVTDAQLAPYAHTLPEPPQPIEGPLMQVRLQNGLNLVPVQGESVPLPTDGADDEHDGITPSHVGFGIVRARSDARALQSAPSFVLSSVVFRGFSGF